MSTPYLLGLLTIPGIAAACAVFYGLWLFVGAFLHAVVIRRRWRGDDRASRARVAAVMATSIRTWGLLLPGGVGMFSLTLRPRAHHRISDRQFAALEHDFRTALTSYETARAEKD